MNATFRRTTAATILAAALFAAPLAGPASAAPAPQDVICNPDYTTDECADALEQIFGPIRDHYLDELADQKAALGACYRTTQDLRVDLNTSRADADLANTLNSEARADVKGLWKSNAQSSRQIGRLFDRIERLKAQVRELRHR